jgi:hypothetical protein
MTQFLDFITWTSNLHNKDMLISITRNGILTALHKSESLDSEELIWGISLLIFFISDSSNVAILEPINFHKGKTYKSLKITQQYTVYENTHGFKHRYLS